MKHAEEIKKLKSDLRRSKKQMLFIMKTANDLNESRALDMVKLRNQIAVKLTKAISFALNEVFGAPVISWHAAEETVDRVEKQLSKTKNKKRKIK